ncbi:MAG TPA: AAA family ATPase [Chlamydiales bacterium]|nr:AAA family ATPase [Chlamydiales bacterium]
MNKAEPVTSPPVPSNNSPGDSNREKDKSLAERIVSLSIPTAVLGYIVNRFLPEITDYVESSLCPFKKYSEISNSYSHPVHWYTLRPSRFKDPRLEGMKPTPIFNSIVTRDFEILKTALCNQEDSLRQLPHAIIYGDYGRGKSTACESIAKGGNWNYCLFMGSNFVNLLQDPSKTIRFFGDVRNLVCPTVLVIDEADCILNPTILLPEKRIDPTKVAIAVQKIKEQAGIRDNKIMFLFILMELPKDLPQDFSDRINYRISVEMPGIEELKAIIQQQAKRYLENSHPNVLKEFTKETVDSLAKELYNKRKNGRFVDHLMSCVDAENLLSQKRLDCSIQVCMGRLKQSFE